MNILKIVSFGIVIEYFGLSFVVLASASTALITTLNEYYFLLIKTKLTSLQNEFNWSLFIGRSRIHWYSWMVNWNGLGCSQYSNCHLVETLKVCRPQLIRLSTSRDSRSMRRPTSTLPKCHQILCIQHTWRLRSPCVVSVALISSSICAIFAFLVCHPT